jgi:hypothetical protein
VRIKSFDPSLAPQNEIKPNTQRLVLEHFRYCAGAKLQPVMYAASAKPNTPTNRHSSPIVCFDEWPPERKNYSSFFISSGLLSSVESLITSFLSAGDWLPPLALDVPFVGLFPQPFTRICLCSFGQLPVQKRPPTPVG